jgi:hypothetical protein
MLSYLHHNYSIVMPGVNYGINTKPPPLCLATSQGSEDIIQLLLNHDWNVNEMDAEG